MTTPFVRSVNGLVSVSWFQTFLRIKTVFYTLLDRLCQLRKSFFTSYSESGSLESVETVLVIKNFLLKLSAVMPRYRTDVLTFPDKKLFSENRPVDLCYIDSVNLRYQSPILNIHMRNLYVHSGTLFIVFGTIPFCNYSFLHSGIIPRIDVSHTRGKFWSAPLFQSKEYPLYVVDNVLAKMVGWFNYTNLKQSNF